MIVYNEEQMLPQCLDSLKKLGNYELVCGVDSRTNDCTREILSKHNAKQFQFAWHDDFSEARNLVMNASLGTHILWIDADDRLTVKGAQVIHVLLEQAPDGVYAFDVNQVAADNGVDIVVPENARLFPNRLDLRWQHCIHEELTADKIQRIPVVAFEHFGYDARFINQEERFKRNIRLLSKRLQLNLYDDKAWEYLQRQRDYIKQYETSKRCVRT